jgi:serine/threonine protein kinase
VQIVNAMSYCHNRGIVHRDLKLENVLFKQPGDLLVKVVDFGIAGVCAGAKKDKVDAGSIAYMPPEVIISYVDTFRHSKARQKLHQPLTSGPLELCSTRCCMGIFLSGERTRMSLSTKS